MLDDMDSGRYQGGEEIVWKNSLSSAVFGVRVVPSLEQYIIYLRFEWLRWGNLYYQMCCSCNIKAAQSCMCEWMGAYSDIDCLAVLLCWMVEINQNGPSWWLIDDWRLTIWRLIIDWWCGMPSKRSLTNMGNFSDLLIGDNKYPKCCYPSKRSWSSYSGSSLLSRSSTHSIYRTISVSCAGLSSLDLPFWHKVLESRHVLIMSTSLVMMTMMR